MPECESNNSEIIDNDYYDNISFLKGLNIVDTKDIIYWYKLKSFIQIDAYNLTKLTINKAYNAIVLDKKMEYRYFCFRYIENIRTRKIHDIPTHSKFESVLIEFREYPHVEFIIRNAILKLPKNWCHSIVCGNLNYKLIKNICDSISSNIRIIKYNRNNLTIGQYSTMLASADFWNNLNGEKILLYQDDTCIFKNNIMDFINYDYDYDYIGAPWIVKNNNDIIVGNGGLSLRTKKIMLDVINTVSIHNIVHDRQIRNSVIGSKIFVPPEDLYFTKVMSDYCIGKIADYDIASKFSVEQCYEGDPFGGHCWWLVMKNDWKTLLYKYVVDAFCSDICVFRS